MKEALLNLALKLFLTKDSIKAIVRTANAKLAEVCRMQGKETYIGYTEDALKEIALRAECLSDDGVITEAELARINDYDCALVDKYWKEK